MKAALIFVFLGTPVVADPFLVHKTAESLFGALARIEFSEDFEAACGGGGNTNPDIAYCTSQNRIFISPTFASRPQAGYEMAHVLGHAIQVRHGVADVALRAITQRREEEDALRGMVTRQVECVAGVLMARAGLALTDLSDVYATEPFTDAHWGRQPVNAGPKVSIGIAARAEWHGRGFAANDFAACSVDEMSADLIVAAERR